MPRPFTLIQLRYFQAVARAQSITTAAARLEVSQSTVSTAMAELERALGVDLFIRRRNRSVVLSPMGRRLWSNIDIFLEQADALYETAQGIRDDEVSGLLRIAVFSPIAPFRAPEIVAAYEHRFPRVRLEVGEGDLAELQELLMSGDCELALAYDLDLPAGFDRTVVARIPPHVLVPHDHPAARAGKPVRLTDFDDEPLIALGLPHSREYYERLFAQLGMEPKVRHRFRNYETVRAFVAAGHGWTVLNQRVPSIGGATQPVALEIVEELPPVEVVLARPAGVTLTRRAERFVEVCAELYADRWPAY
ncbi:LysR family transcriptional regulator [Naumannella halotolerans]|uniref:LysR family transcriptional regulator n=1 Tax=Naumannella halotolerans TaxID=993414 RepID=UPI00370D5FCA